MPTECAKNVNWFNEDELELMYPNKGKYTYDQLIDASFVKAVFESGDTPPNREYLWIKVDRVTDSTVIGKVDNVAVNVDYQVGEVIEVSYDRIVQILSESKKNWMQCSLCSDRFPYEDSSIIARMDAHEHQKHNPVKKRASSNTKTGKVYWRLEQD